MINVEMPNSYMCWDLETGGFSSKYERIIEIGAAIVNNGVIVSRRSWILNQPDYEIPVQASNVHGITTEIMKKEGMDPKQALLEFFSLYESLNDVGHVILTHNGIQFVIPFLEGELVYQGLQEQLGHFVTVMKETAIDSMVLYKGRSLDMVQRYNESFTMFAKRVNGMRVKGLKSNITYCLAKEGIEIDGELHRALIDVEVTHMIYQRLLSGSDTFAVGQK